MKPVLLAGRKVGMDTTIPVRNVTTDRLLMLIASLHKNTILQNIIPADASYIVVNHCRKGCRHLITGVLCLW